MNVFEMFGFFMLGSLFNALVMVAVLLLVISSIKKALNENIGVLSERIGILIEKVEKVTSIFKKGGKNEDTRN